jgi:hypothetical protein
MDLGAFKSNFSGGTRANRFLISGGIGGNAESQKFHTFHVRSTFIPPITNFVLSVDAYGRKLNIPGDRQYAPWQLTIYDDVESGNEQSNNPKELWRLFSNWHNNINRHSNNTTAIAAPYTNYKNTWTIEHLDLNGNTNSLKKFILRGCWPKSISDIDFNMTRRNFLNTFSVIMLYDEVEVVGAGVS